MKKTLNTMKSVRKLLILFFVVTLISVIPFLILGESFEDEVRQWFESDFTVAERFALIVGLLAVDIAIPVPSSAVSTYGGAILGIWSASLASWLGLMIGSIAGFALAKSFGPKLVNRFSNEEDLQLMITSLEKYSAWTIILTRPLPILAEATILLCGILRMRWSQLLLPLILSNLLIAVSYSAIGAWAVERNVTIYVIISSMIIPLLMTLAIRKIAINE